MEPHGEKGRQKILINLSSLLLCQAVQELLDREPGKYQTLAAVDIGSVDHFAPDKILVDANTLARKGFSRWSEVKLILIDTGLHEEDIIALLLNHKLHGVISTATDHQLFRKALAAVRDGQVWIDNSKLKALLHSRTHPFRSPAAREALSKKERDIVLLIAEGRKNREIAEQLHISEQTVKAHISRIFRKVNATSRSQLVPLALAFRVPSSQQIPGLAPPDSSGG